jgi:hypothetical protein
VSGASYAIGLLELVSLQTLRDRMQINDSPSGTLKVRVVRGDVRSMHQSKDNSGALFQVASQFNLLEMVSPDISPSRA